MRITKVYTRTGDKGTTRLVGGACVRKDSARVEAYGTVDELNAIVGLVRAFLGVDSEALFDSMLGTVQNDLFNVGTDLATPEASRWDGMHRVDAPEIANLEAWIDQLNDGLAPLTEFILPGGGKVGSFLHQARTVCRRAERRVVALDEDSLGGCLRYLNRLSDFFFVAARWCAKSRNEPEVLWANPNR